MDPVDPNLGVERAKSDAQRFELEVADAVPADLVDNVEQREKGSLLRCGADNAFVWTGNAKVHVKEPASSTRLLQDLADEFDGSFSEEAGRPEVLIADPEAQDLILTMRSDGNYLNVTSGPRVSNSMVTSGPVTCTDRVRGSAQDLDVVWNGNNPREHPAFEHGERWVAR